MANPHVNNFYRVWFTWVDPIVLVFTVIGCILTPATAVDALVPASISPYQPYQAGLIYQTAALYAFLGIIFGVLLRASPDPKVWRIVQAATLLVDISLLVVFQDGLRLQGRLDTAKWRGIDWFNCLFTGWVALIRVGFLTGVGGGNNGNAKKRL